MARFITWSALLLALCSPPGMAGTPIVQPMPLLLLTEWQSASDYPFFVAEDAVLSASGAVNDEILHPAAATAIADYLALTETEGCTILSPSEPVYLESPPPRTTLAENARSAEAVIVGEVTGTRPGFRGSDAGTLVRIAPTAFVKSTERLQRDLYYVFFPVGEVQVGNRRFCAEAEDFPPLPSLGDSVAVFASRRAALPGSLLWIFDGRDVAVLKQGGILEVSPHYSSQEIEAHDAEGLIRALTRIARDGR